MADQKLIVACPPPPSSRDLWRRSSVWVAAVLAASLGVILLWRFMNWPGAVVVRSLVVGFGIAFGARYASTGRIRGPRMAVPIVIGTATSAAFFALWTFAA
jgi:predicted cobalt transporter CbtA